jgi:hypothetical protein
MELEFCGGTGWSYVVTTAVPHINNVDYRQKLVQSPSTVGRMSCIVPVSATEVWMRRYCDVNRLLPCECTEKCTV